MKEYYHFMGSKIVVLGGLGFLGSILALALVESAADEIISLPIHTNLSDVKILYIADKVKEFAEQMHG